jgi:hypothetical protein
VGWRNLPDEAAAHDTPRRLYGRAST